MCNPPQQQPTQAPTVVPMDALETQEGGQGGSGGQVCSPSLLLDGNHSPSQRLSLEVSAAKWRRRPCAHGSDPCPGNRTLCSVSHPLTQGIREEIPMGSFHPLKVCVVWWLATQVSKQ